MRRVELAKALLIGARVLLLDEPSTGLDPGARRDLLIYLRELRDAAGITVVLTTHDMEEAERCERVAILDRGRLVGLGPPEALRARVGGDVLVVQTDAPDVLREQVRARFGLEGRLVDGTLRLERARGHELVRDLIDAFPDAIRAVSYGKPTLDDVFVQLTGHRLAEG
jgi:ABC-2 type transport system ATP-binding protein